MSEAWSDIRGYVDAAAKAEASKAASLVLCVMVACALMYAVGVCITAAKIKDLGRRVELLEKQEASDAT